MLALPSFGAPAPGFRFDRPERPVNGGVEGVVKDRATGELLPGATVVVDGTALGTATDSDGRYRLTGVPDGPQTLIVSYVGYRSVRVPATIVPNETIQLDVELELDVIEGQEIIVTAQAEGQIAAINAQLASNTIINVVSAARIQELPDANAAESVGRLPGVSMVRSAGEGQKVVIRGLAPQYNTVTVNGRQLPATSDDRSTDLSLVSSDLLAGIELTKAHTSDQDGDYLGGSVNFKLADAPEGFHSDARIQGGYNNQQTQFGQFKGSISVSDRFLGNRLGVIVQGNAEDVNRSSDVFNASYRREGQATVEGELAPLYISSLTLNDRIEARKRYGASVLLDYRLPHGKIKFTNFFSRLDRDVVTHRKSYGISDRIVGYGLRDQDITTDLLSNEISGEYQLGPAFITWGLSRAISNRETPYDNEFTFDERNGFDTATLVEDQGPELIPAAARNTLSETAFSSGNFRTNKLRERDLLAQLDIKVPYVIGKQMAGYVKAGGKLRNKDRLNDESRSLMPFTFGPGADLIEAAFPDIDFTFASQGFLGMERILDTGYDAGDFLDGQYAFGFTPDLTFINQAYERIGGEYFRSSLGEFDDFQNTEDLSAAYVMTELNIGRWFMVMPGVRYEQTDTKYTAAQGRAADDRQTDAVRLDTTVSQSYHHVLPMIHVRIKPTSWFDIRVARTETISRPNHYDISPRLTISTNGRSVNRGIPALRPSEATNYDVFLSFKSNRLGLLTLGGYTKDIKGLIYTRNAPVLVPAELDLPADTRGYTVTEPFNNTGTTEVKGYEVDWQTNLSFLPKPFNGIVFNVNYTRIESETQYPRSLLQRNPSGFGFVRVDTFRVGNMINQAANIANFSVGYDLKGFSGRVSMLLQGESLNGVGTVPELDQFTGTYVRWDLSVKQAVTPRLSLFLNANNFTDRPDRAFQVIEGFPTAQEYYGWTVDLGVRFRY
ncbi:MAG: TonB-dependent receptor [Rhodothermales bacterium]